jgi:hypothetical protein
VRQAMPRHTRPVRPPLKAEPLSDAVDRDGTRCPNADKNSNGLSGAVAGEPEHPPVMTSRSATAVGSVTMETLAYELPNALALHRGELGEAFAHDPPETLALHRGELGNAFAHHPPDTLALRRGEVGEAFAHHPPEMLALERGELGEAFAHFPPEMLAFRRGQLGEAVALNRPAHAAPQPRPRSFSWPLLGTGRAVFEHNDTESSWRIVGIDSKRCDELHR